MVFVVPGLRAGGPGTIDQQEQPDHPVDIPNRYMAISHDRRFRSSHRFTQDRRGFLGNPISFGYQQSSQTKAVLVDRGDLDFVHPDH